MARWGCVCDNVLASSDCPSKDILHIYYRKYADAALVEDPDITLWDFYSKDWVYEYWYCDNCRRIYEFDLRKRDSLRLYRKADREEYQEEALNADWQEVYIFTDIEIDDITEIDFNIGLAEFIRTANRPYRFWYNPLKKVMQAYATESGTFEFAYILEEEQNK